jgi:hypothetical protein
MFPYKTMLGERLPRSFVEAWLPLEFVTAEDRTTGVARESARFLSVSAG